MTGFLRGYVIILALVAAWFVVLPLVLFVGVPVCAYSWIWLDGMKLRKVLRRKDRLISLANAKAKIRENQGMIIVDAPTLGWGVSRVWWSPTIDFAVRPESWDGEEMSPPEDIANYNTFIDPTIGVAKLVDHFIMDQRVKAYLKKHFGSDAYSFIFTSGVLFDRGMKESNNKKTK